MNVYKVSSDGHQEKRTYHRILDKTETKEIVLHGYDGNDVYEISGKTNRALLIRIIDGSGNSNIINSSGTKGRSKKPKVIYKVEKAIYLN